MMKKLMLLLLLCSLGICFPACASSTRVLPTSVALEKTLVPLDPDNEADAMPYAQVEETFGPLSTTEASYKIGVVLKFFGNQYWQLLANGVQDKASQLEVNIDVRAAATETDPEGQRQIMEDMLGQDYDAFIISPQTDDNLVEVVREAQQAGLIVLVVNEIVLDARHWVGPNQYEIGVAAANYFHSHLSEQVNVAVIEGLPGAYAARQRTLGFREALVSSSVQVVASEPGNWDSHQALEQAADVLDMHPDIRGFYCNNDVMAMGVIEAVNAVDKLDQIMIIGTDGIEPAYDAIRAGELTATIDSFPFITGQIALEITVRLLEGQAMPRVVYSPQALITAENVDQPLP